MAILLDMDGVLCDFVKSACVAFNFDPDDVYRNWKPGVYDVAEVFGINNAGGWDGQEKLWATIDARGEYFWATLPEYRWSRELYDECSKFDDIYFLTSPTRNPSCASGKLKWIQAFMGNKAASNFLIGPAKHLCARQDNVLIDDYEYNVDKFRDAGGKAILFPQPWNRLGRIEYPVVTVMKELREIYDKKAD